MASKPVKGFHYVAVWLALVALTVVSFGLGKVPMGDLGLTVALTIAGVKAILVAMFFMHLRESTFVTQFTAVVVFLFIVLLCLGIAGDIALR